jgi:excinuclease ABC subunit A
MRLLLARVGRTHCRNCGKEVVRETAEVIARQLGALPPGTRLLLGFDLRSSRPPSRRTCLKSTS